MAKKDKTVFVCQECGNESSKWMGQCICGAWNSMLEEKLPQEINTKGVGGSGHDGFRKEPRLLAHVDATGEEDRLNTGISELNRVLGGGVVKGSLTLISGEPGIGKSTIIMECSYEISKSGRKVLYVSGEESETQIKLRAKRICAGDSDNLYILVETCMEAVVAAVEKLKPEFIIVDSIQTMYSEEWDSSPGSVSQVRACSNMLMRLGKRGNISVFIVAHVTKSGDLAGPKIVEHLVDCVLHFSGERNAELRILRSFKNRFGNTSEVGAFEMTEKGLMEITDLSGRFLEHTGSGVEGSVVTAVYEGTRPMLLEMQALVSPTSLNFPRRTSIGMDQSRLNMILAVMERKAGVSTAAYDVYVNIVGGLRPEGTSTDLAAAMAIFSSIKKTACREGVLALGEIGLTGELRAVQNADKIVEEAVRMGFTRMILPKAQATKLQKGSMKKSAANGVRIMGAADIIDCIGFCFER